MMNKSLSPLLIDLNTMLAGRVVATGIRNGASLNCIDGMVTYFRLVLKYELGVACGVGACFFGLARMESVTQTRKEWNDSSKLCCMLAIYLITVQ